MSSNKISYRGYIDFMSLKSVVKYTNVRVSLNKETTEQWKHNVVILSCGKQLP